MYFFLQLQTKKREREVTKKSFGTKQHDLRLQIGKRGLKKGMKNGVIWSKIGSGFGKPGGTPDQKFRGVFAIIWYNNTTQHNNTTLFAP